MDYLGSVWQQKGGTLSDKTARKEFGLTQEGIEAAIRAGKLQYRYAAMHGNPFLKLIRQEVEKLVAEKHGDRYLKERQARTELARVDAELKRLRAEVVALEERRATLVAETTV